MKHVAKFAPIITISWQINELEKILTGPGKLSGVSRNGPLKDGAFVVLDSKEGIFAMPPARGEPIHQKEDSRPYDIGLVFKNMISLSGQDNYDSWRMCGNQLSFLNSRGQSTMANPASLTCHG